jgi:hypothetical protein
MNTFGAWLIFWGMLSLVLGLFGRHLAFLYILDAFGPFMGYVLKIGLILAGIWVRRREGLTVEDVPVEGKKGAWIPVVVSGVVIIGIITYVAGNLIWDALLEHRVKHPVPAAGWASTPTSEWPDLVLLQKAEFEHHTPMEAGRASLVRLPSGDIVALTAGHLLGEPGGVSPGFLDGGPGRLDPNRLATLTAEITSWDLFLPGREERAVEVVGLFGQAGSFDTNCDQVLLQLSPHDRVYPVKPLDMCLGLVPFGESLHVITFATDTNGNPRQVVYNAKRIPGLFFACELEKPVDLRGCSGAPVVDNHGLIVGIVTGGIQMDLNSPSNTVHAFSGHLVSELMPVLKSAMTAGKPANARRAGL